MSFSVAYTSVACNRSPESADWGENGLIACAASNYAAIIDPKINNSCKIIQTLYEHTGKVNAVKWISKTELLSSSYDKTCIHWDISDENQPKISKLIGHTEGVTFIDSICVDGKRIIATTSLDSSIRLWQRDATTGEYVTFDSIGLGNGFCFAIRMVILPGTKNILLAIATDDSNVHLYSNSGNSPSDETTAFTKLHTLSGHTDWVRGLDFITLNDNDVLLATSSQDTFIRLWRLSKRNTNLNVAVKTASCLSYSDELQIEEKILTVAAANGAKHSFAIALESVLLGHEGWVYGVHWNYTKDGSLRLLSSSIDKTLIIWESHDQDDVWVEKVRVGEVGGNSLGFYGGKFAPNGDSIFGHGYQGTFHIWHQNCALGENVWTPGTIIGGHFAEARDLCWDPYGQFLLSVSADQTTRCHGPWKQKNNNSEHETWHEIARPQVHGYDLQAICPLSRYRFASGAEEKIIRTFQAPANFVNNFRRMCDIKDDVEGDEILKCAAVGASVPSLGLSNKVVYEETENRNTEDRHVKDQYPENYFIAIDLESPPTEENLMQNTLWPEMQKLYGHGYEIYALAATTDGKILASSCRATNEEHAQIIIWNTTTWKSSQKLVSHQLTITQMKFSPDNKYLLSVGRDRRWSIFKIDYRKANDDQSFNFELLAASSKHDGIHSRIIWTCDWSHDSKVFVTGSRDAKLVAWTHPEETTDGKQSNLGGYKAFQILNLQKDDSVTAAAFAQNYFKDQHGCYLVAIGLETGYIHLYSLSNTWEQLLTINREQAHSLTVKRLAFRPITKDQSKTELASCGVDNLVRIYQLNL